MLCPAGSIPHGSIPADVGWQHTVSLWHGAGSALRPFSSGGMPSLCAGGPSWASVCYLSQGIARAGRGSPSHSPLPAVPLQGGKPPSVALMESPFCVASGLCTYLVSACAQTSVVAQDRILPLKTLPLCVRPSLGTATPLGCCCGVPAKATLQSLTKPVCRPCLQPCSQTCVGSLLGGGLSPPCCCQTHVCPWPPVL